MKILTNLDLRSCNPKQYAILILREELGYSWEKCGIRLQISRHAAKQLYIRAVQKEKNK